MPVSCSPERVPRTRGLVKEQRTPALPVGIHGATTPTRRYSPSTHSEAKSAPRGTPSRFVVVPEQPELDAVQAIWGKRGASSRASSTASVPLELAPRRAPPPAPGNSCWPHRPRPRSTARSRASATPPVAAPLRGRRRPRLKRLVDPCCGCSTLFVVLLRDAVFWRYILSAVVGPHGASHSQC